MRNQLKNIIIGLLVIVVVGLGVANYHSQKELEVCRENLNVGESEETIATSFTAGHNFSILRTFYAEGFVEEEHFKSIEKMVDDFFSKPTYDKAYQILENTMEELDNVMEEMMNEGLQMPEDKDFI